MYLLGSTGAAAMVENSYHWSLGILGVLCRGWGGPQERGHGSGGRASLNHRTPIGLEGHLQKTPMSDTIFLNPLPEKTDMNRNFGVQDRKG